MRWLLVLALLAGCGETRPVRDDAPQEPAPRAKLDRIAGLIADGEPRAVIRAGWEALVRQHPGMNVDHSIRNVQAETDRILREQVKAAEKEKRTAESAVDDLQGVVVLCNIELQKPRNAKLKFSRKPTGVRSPPKEGEILTSRKEIEALRNRSMKRLQQAEDRSSLAEVRLQEAGQRQQRTLQTLSNVSKMMHDTAMAIIRKIGN